MDRLYDVIVVGAGPAGSVSAYLLARRGFRVLLVEKANLPRYKTCGGGLTRKTLRNLPFDASSTFEETAAGGILTYKGQQLVKTAVPDTVAWLVMRADFDLFLAHQAVEAGARLVEGVSVRGTEQEDGRVSVQTAQGDFEARCVVGADGIRSPVARSNGLLSQRKTGVALELELAVPPEALEEQGAYATFDFSALPYGYGWVFPKREHLSVGVFRARPGKVPDLRQRLQAFIATQPVLTGYRTIQEHGHHIPIGGLPYTGKAQPLHKGQVLLVGDAANLADPFLGEGICYAIQSARIAAEEIARAFEASEFDLSLYTTRIQREILRQFGYARWIARVVYHFPRLSSALMMSNVSLQEGVFAVMRGDMTFEQLAYSLFWSIPKLFLNLRFA
jgi:geranylgeranyl reductase family protein